MTYFIFWTQTTLFQVFHCVSSYVNTNMPHYLVAYKGHSVVLWSTLWKWYIFSFKNWLAVFLLSLSYTIFYIIYSINLIWDRNTFNNKVRALSVSRQLSLWCKQLDCVVITNPVFGYYNVFCQAGNHSCNMSDFLRSNGNMVRLSTVGLHKCTSREQYSTPHG